MKTPDRRHPRQYQQSHEQSARLSRLGVVTAIGAFVTSGALVVGGHNIWPDREAPDFSSAEKAYEEPRFNPNDSVYDVALDDKSVAAWQSRHETAMSAASAGLEPALSGGELGSAVRQAVEASFDRSASFVIVGENGAVFEFYYDDTNDKPVSEDGSSRRQRVSVKAYDPDNPVKTSYQSAIGLEIADSGVYQGHPALEHDATVTIEGGGVSKQVNFHSEAIGVDTNNHHRGAFANVDVATTVTINGVELGLDTKEAQAAVTDAEDFMADMYNTLQHPKQVVDRADYNG